jgi:hypothetical protein
MTARPPAPTEPDFVEAPYEDDDERAETEWLLARQSDPAAPPPSAAVAREYRALEHLLTSLPVGTSGDAWQADVLRKVAATVPPAAAVPPAAPLPWWQRAMLRWTVGAGLAAAFAGFLFVLLRDPAPDPPPSNARLAITTEHDGAARQVRGDRDAVPRGDSVSVRATLPAGQPYELRVYGSGDGPPIVRCPGGPRCEATSDGVRVTFRAEERGKYSARLVVGRLDVPADASLTAFLTAAAHAGLEPETQPIDVQ